MLCQSVMWPSAVVLSQWLMTNPSVVAGKRVIELGAGCGLTGLVAARIQKKLPCSLPNDHHPPTTVVCLTDSNPIVLDNLQRNAELNNVSDVCRVVGLDFYQQTGRSERSWKDIKGCLQEPVDVVLAADIICQPDDAVAAANTIHDTLRPGGLAFVVCADGAHRFGVDGFAAECERAGLHVRVHKDPEAIGCGNDLLRMGLNLTAGYVEGMKLTMFHIAKPMQ